MYLDQAIFSPVAVGFFFGSMSVLEGKGLGGAAERISHVRLAEFFSGPSLTTRHRSSGICPDTTTELVRCGWNSNASRTVLILNFRAVYIPAQVINFALVPPHLRFVFVGVVSLFWSKSLPSFLPEGPDFFLTLPDTYLSAVNAKERGLHDVEKTGRVKA